MYAVCLPVRLHDNPGMVADILKEADLETWDCSGLKDFEKEILRTINKEKDMNLRGLR
jgi:hypothetical protein